MKLAHLEQLGPEFESASQLAGNIADQNGRSEQVFTEIEDADFQYLAQRGLQQEQADTFRELTDKVNNLPYLEVGHKYISTIDRLGELAQRLANIEIEVEEAVQKVDTAAETTIRLAPNTENEARLLAEAKRAQLQDDTIAGLQAEITSLSGRKARLEELFFNGENWELPKLPFLVSEAEEDEPEDETTTIVIEEIPVPPTILEGREGLKEYIERHIDQPQASAMIAYYLTEKSKSVVSVEELYEFLYSQSVVDNLDDHHLRSRITTLLGPKRSSQNIQWALAEDGLILQWGWRYTKTYQGEKVARLCRHRIYRAVPENEFNSYYLQKVVTGNTTLVWETTKEQRDMLLGLPENGDTPYADPQDSENEAVEEGEAIVNNPEASDPVVTTPEKKVTNIEPAPWEKEFAERVDDAIELLKQENLLQRESLTLKQVAQRSNRQTMGTKTAVERLRQAGIIKVARRYRNNPNLTVNPAQLVAMSLMNTSRELLGKGPRQDRALEVIRSKLEIALQKLEREQKLTNTAA